MFTDRIDMIEWLGNGSRGLKNSICKNQVFRLGSSRNIMQLIIAALLLVFALLLTACSPSSKNSGESSLPDSSKDNEQSTGVEDVSKQEPQEANEEELEEEVQEEQSLLECEGIILESNAVIEGGKLADCIVAAMLAAGTGTHRVESSVAPPTVVDFLWDPDFSMNVREGQNSVIIKGNTGWYKGDNGKWIQEEDHSSDPDVNLANGIIKLTRVFSNPLVLRDYFASSPTWIVVGEESVPADDAVSDIAWHLVPEAPINYNGVMLTDVGIWLTSNYLAAYYVSTATMMGVTDTTSNTFLQWGEKVEIPDPS